MLEKSFEIHPEAYKYSQPNFLLYGDSVFPSVFCFFCFLLALPPFLASAFGASDFPRTIFLETFEDVLFTKALEKWLSLTNEQESPLDGTQKNCTQPVYVKTAQDSSTSFLART